MSLELLDKTRKINRLLTEQETEKLNFNDLCKVLSDALEACVLLASRKGKVLGIWEREGIGIIPQFKGIGHGSYIDRALHERFMGILSIKENASLQAMGLDWEDAERCQAMAAPVIMSGKRLGTLFIYRYGTQFTIDDIILAEYGTTVIGLAMQSAKSEECSEEHRKEMDIKSAVKTLSRLEVQAMAYVLDELGGASDGTLITSRLADRVGITRSVIVNALKKCESAGIIETKSAGVKGTNIHIANNLFCGKILMPQDMNYNI
ncbi:MAG: GTP-sensing pleiotropic transcriptional regulator CodY [Lachnospiraceae bacterium]